MLSAWEARMPAIVCAVPGCGKPAVYTLSRPRVGARPGWRRRMCTQYHVAHIAGPEAEATERVLKKPQRADLATWALRRFPT